MKRREHNESNHNQYQEFISLDGDILANWSNYIALSYLIPLKNK